LPISPKYPKKPRRFLDRLFDRQGIKNLSAASDFFKIRTALNQLSEKDKEKSPGSRGFFIVH